MKLERETMKIHCFTFFTTLEFEERFFFFSKLNHILCFVKESGSGHSGSVSRFISKLQKSKRKLNQAESKVSEAEAEVEAEALYVEAEATLHTQLLLTIPSSGISLLFAAL